MHLLGGPWRWLTLFGSHRRCLCLSQFCVGLAYSAGFDLVSGCSELCSEGDVDFDGTCSGGRGLLLDLRGDGLRGVVNLTSYLVPLLVVCFAHVFMSIDLLPIMLRRCKSTLTWYWSKMSLSCGSAE